MIVVSVVIIIMTMVVVFVMMIKIEMKIKEFLQETGRSEMTMILVAPSPAGLAC